MRENNVLVIGNGFDLAHGMRTKYEDFIEYVKENRYERDEMLTADEVEMFRNIVPKNGFIKYLQKLTTVVPGWVDFEREIYRITKEIEALLENYANMFPYRTLNQYCENTASPLLVDILLDFHICVRSSGRILIEPQYYSNKYGINKKAVLSQLKFNLYELIKLLELYLFSCQRELENSVENRKIEQIESIAPSYVISFNYTSTYELYNIDSARVAHIHGKLGSNNMVLGFEDEDESDLDFIYFKKYFQRLQKLTGHIHYEKIRRSEQGMPAEPVIHFWGHSMDKTDEDIITELKSVARKFVIYVYNQDDYEQKVINLISVFGKKKTMHFINGRIIEFVQCK